MIRYISLGTTPLIGETLPLVETPWNSQVVRPDMICNQFLNYVDPRIYHIFIYVAEADVTNAINSRYSPNYENILGFRYMIEQKFPEMPFDIVCIHAEKEYVNTPKIHNFTVPFEGFRERAIKLLSNLEGFRVSEKFSTAWENFSCREAFAECFASKKSEI